ncbi:HEPN domain-containing protein [Nocardia testacea]|uniref:HEPN domain-containing protein n=1 Tax=Nocardia testacea TaxID=248551 RepID=UPI003A8B538B
MVFDGPSARVTVNDDVHFWAIAGRNAEIVDPSEHVVGQITDLMPHSVDPRLTWTGFVTAEGGRGVIMDYLANVVRVATLVDRAHKFLRSAQATLETVGLEPAVEQLFSAAELSVMTLIQVAGWDDRRLHHRRKEWIAAHVAEGAMPAAFEKAFRTLYKNRNLARYGEGELTFDTTEALNIIDTVAAMVEFARSRRQDMAETQSAPEGR